MDIQWIESKYFNQVLALEELDCKWLAWNELDLERELHERNVVGRVVLEGDSQVVGYSIYEVYPKRIIIRKLVGIHDLVLKYLLDDLLQRKRARVYFLVSDTRLDVQVCLRSAGFRAIKVVENDELALDEYSYVFEYVSVSALVASGCGVSEMQEKCGK